METVFGMLAVISLGLYIGFEALVKALAYGLWLAITLIVVGLLLI